MLLCIHMTLRICNYLLFVRCDCDGAASGTFDPVQRDLRGLRALVADSSFSNRLIAKHLANTARE